MVDPLGSAGMLGWWLLGLASLTWILLTEPGVDQCGPKSPRQSFRTSIRLVATGSLDEQREGWDR